MRSARAALVWLLCGAFVLSGLGFLPSVERLAALGRAGRGDERYPCEGCACGCDTAEHCWTQCCCHSLDERLAWAEAHGVALPRAVASMAFTRLQQRAREASLPACCRSGDGADSGARCCATPAPRVKLRLPAMSSLACKGVAGWLVPCAAPPVAPIALSCVCPEFVADRFAPAGALAPPVGPSFDPPHPPPRA